MGKTVVAFAPGRVELLGNHTDYNEGLALAVAIHLGVTGLNLLQSIVEHGVKRVILSSTAKVSIFGDDYPTRDGTCVRDYIHVMDLAQAHILALGAVGGHSRFYNLGNGKGFTVKEVIDTAREVTGRTITVDAAPRRAGDPAVLVAASNKIGKELGWAPQLPHMREIVESAWQWHQANPNGY
jgi:UDP-glucose 4-epimerase